MKKDSEHFNLIKDPQLNGWMADKEQVEKLIFELEKMGWNFNPNNGETECVDQASAMAADALKTILLPMLDQSKEIEENNISHHVWSEDDLKKKCDEKGWEIDNSNLDALDNSFYFKANSKEMVAFLNENIEKPNDLKVNSIKISKREKKDDFSNIPRPRC